MTLLMRTRTAITTTATGGEMMKDLFVVIAYIVIIALIVVVAYFISISDLPD